MEERHMNEEKLLILPLNDSTAKKISLALANETSRKVLGALAEEPLAASQISEKLGMQLTTLHYNIENLIEVGLIKVERTRYSEKGREVKIYAPTRKYIVIAPENVGKEEVKSTLKKFLFGIYFLLAAGASGYIFQKLYYKLGALLVAAPQIAPMLEKAVPAPITVPTPEPTVTQVASFYIWFVFGAIFALALLFLWKKAEARVWKK